MKFFAILYFTAMLILAAVAAIVASGCSHQSQIPECEWDASCDEEALMPPKTNEEIADEYGLQLEVQKPKHPKRKIKK